MVILGGWVFSYERGTPVQPYTCRAPRAISFCGSNKLRSKFPEGKVALVGMHRMPALPPERAFFIDNLLVRLHFIIVMIRWTGLAPWGG